MMCEQMITLLRSVNHQCLVLKNNAGEKVYIDLAPVADKLESQQRELAAAKAELERLVNIKELWKQKAREHKNSAVNCSKEYHKLNNKNIELHIVLAQAEAQCAAMLDCFGNLINRIDNGEDCFEELEPPSGFLGKTIHPNNMEYIEACEVLDDVKSAGTSLLTRLHRMEGALRDIMTVDCAYPEHDGTPCCIYMMAKAALEVINERSDRN